jgi:isopenicillin-N epimerase
VSPGLSPALAMSTVASGTAPRPAAAPHLPGRAPHADAWALDPAITFLNHGSFGATPRAVLEVQALLRAELERNPVAFLDRALESRLDAVRTRLAAFVGAAPENLALVPNATHGVATVLRSLRFAPGDELLATDHEYNAALNMLRAAGARDGARVVLARLPLPTAGPDEIIDRVLAAAGRRTRLALISHITSPTALVLPIGPLVTALEARGCSRSGDGATRPRCARRQLVHGQPAQVDMRAEGRRVPPRPARPPRRDQAAGDQPRGERPSAWPLHVPQGVRLDRYR